MEPDPQRAAWVLSALAHPRNAEQRDRFQAAARALHARAVGTDSPEVAKRDQDNRLRKGLRRAHRTVELCRWLTLPNLVRRSSYSQSRIVGAMADESDDFAGSHGRDIRRQVRDRAPAFHLAIAFIPCEEDLAEDLGAAGLLPLEQTMPAFLLSDRGGWSASCLAEARRLQARWADVLPVDSSLRAVRVDVDELLPLCSLPPP